MVVRGYIFKKRRDEKEAVITGSMNISCRCFLTSEKMLQFEVNTRVLETTSFIFTLTITQNSQRIKPPWGIQIVNKCFFTASKFSVITHTLLAAEISKFPQLKIKNFLVEPLLYFTIDAVGNVEVYHKIRILQGTECTWPWARLQFF